MYTSKTPLISVVMPVYNVQDTLGLAIASVLQQSFEEYELILVDDGSTDNSFVICQIMSLQDRRVRMIHQSNKGLAAARNTGIENARAEIIAFLDSDDLWQPEKLKKHFEHLSANPQIGVSYSASEFIDASGASIGLYQQPKLDNITAKDILLRNPIGNGSAPVIRKAVLEQIAFKDHNDECNYFDASLRQSEDIECWVRIATTTKWQFAGLGDALTSYRVNNSGLSANTQKQLKSWQVALQKMSVYAPKLVTRYQGLAKANQLRYLARRAVRSKDSKQALSLIGRAIRTKPSILIYQPIKTGLTLGAALCLKFMPMEQYRQIETRMISLVAKLSKREGMDLIKGF